MRKEKAERRKKKINKKGVRKERFSIMFCFLKSCDNPLVILKVCMLFSKYVMFANISSFTSLPLDDNIMKKNVIQVRKLLLILMEFFKKSVFYISIILLNCIKTSLAKSQKVSKIFWNIILSLTTFAIFIFKFYCKFILVKMKKINYRPYF